MVRVVVTEPVHPDALRLLAEAGCEVVEGAPLDPAALEVELAAAEVVMVRTRRLDPALMTGPLRMVAKHGVGTDNIPLDAARAAGVAVANTPAANARSVAEHALTLMLALAKALPAMTAAARATGRPAPARVVDLAGRRLLVVGHGRTGQRVAELAAAFGMRVRVLSPRHPGEVTAAGHPVLRRLAEALPDTDVLSLHCPLNDETRGMIGAAELALLPPGALVVNTARGGLIDEAALARAAAEGRIGGFALDVLAEEPIPPGHPLLDLPNGIVTPHSAAMSEEAFRQMGMDAAQNILDFLAGRPDPAHVVVPGR